MCMWMCTHPPPSSMTTLHDAWTCVNVNTHRCSHERMRMRTIILTAPTHTYRLWRPYHHSHHHSFRPNQPSPAFARNCVGSWTWALTWAIGWIS